MESAVWEKLEAEYKPRLIVLAEQVRRDMMAEGWKCSEVDEFTDEDLAVMFVYWPEGSSEDNPEHAIDLTFRLLDAAAWDGTENGTSFAVDICEYGGSVVGGLHPFNYSDQVWVDPTDAEAVAARWELFENGASDSQELMAVIKQFRESS